MQLWKQRSYQLPHLHFEQQLPIDPDLPAVAAALPPTHHALASKHVVNKTGSLLQLLDWSLMFACGCCSVVLYAVTKRSAHPKTFEASRHLPSAFAAAMHWYRSVSSNCRCLQLNLSALNLLCTATHLQITQLSQAGAVCEGCQLCIETVLLPTTCRPTAGSTG